MRVSICLGEQGVASLDIAMDKAEDLDKVWDMKYHLEAILNVLAAKPEDEDED